MIEKTLEEMGAFIDDSEEESLIKFVDNNWLNKW